MLVKRGGLLEPLWHSLPQQQLARRSNIIFIFTSPCFLWLYTVFIHLYIFSNVLYLCQFNYTLFLVISERPRALIGELNSTEILLRILQEYDMLSKT